MAANNLKSVGDIAAAVGPVVVTLYGILTGIVGAVKKSKNGK